MTNDDSFHPSQSVFSIPDEVFFKFKQEADYQATIMKETSELLSTFRHKMKYCGTQGHIQAERLLLLSGKYLLYLLLSIESIII